MTMANFNPTKRFQTYIFAFIPLLLESTGFGVVFLSWTLIMICMHRLAGPQTHSLAHTLKCKWNSIEAFTSTRGGFYYICHKFQAIATLGLGMFCWMSNLSQSFSQKERSKMFTTVWNWLFDKANNRENREITFSIPKSTTNTRRVATREISNANRVKIYMDLLSWYDLERFLWAKIYKQHFYCEMLWAK